MPRENFSIEVKRRLAQRAGYRCSICNCSTVGPSDEANDAVNLTGVAAHIAAASVGGRRYSDLPEDSEQRTEIENGIWLCSTHADLIDGDEMSYTSSILKGLKKKHEYRIGLEHRGVKAENGLITKIELTNFGSIRNCVSLEFDNNNLILGGNGVGKTLICEMIAALTNKRYLDRWHKYDWDKRNSHCSIYYYKNDIYKFGISISAKNQVTYSFRDATIPFVSAPFSVFYLTEDIYTFRNRINRERDDVEEPPLDETDFLTWLSLYFNLTNSEFSNVIDSMSKEKKFFINDIRIDQQNSDIEVMYWGKPGEDFHSYNAFSGGEKQRIILDIALRIATYYAKFQTTILLLENTAIGTIDQTGINKLLEIVNSQDLGFQFIFTSFQDPEYFKTSGYTIHQLITDKRQDTKDSPGRNNPVSVKKIFN